MAKDKIADVAPEAVIVGYDPPEFGAPREPDGVYMIDAAHKPQHREMNLESARTRREPPPNWKGSFTRCGDCGDFLGLDVNCSNCARVNV